MDTEPRMRAGRNPLHDKLLDELSHDHTILQTLELVTTLLRSRKAARIEIAQQYAQLSSSRLAKQATAPLPTRTANSLVAVTDEAA
jgi:hypothetical protein